MIFEFIRHLLMIAPDGLKELGYGPRTPCHRRAPQPLRRRLDTASRDMPGPYL